MDGPVDWIIHESYSQLVLQMNIIKKTLTLHSTDCLDHVLQTNIIKEHAGVTPALHSTELTLVQAGIVEL